MSAERASVPPNPERSERAYLILRERSEGEVHWRLILREGVKREAVFW